VAGKCEPVPAGLPEKSGVAGKCEPVPAGLPENSAVAGKCESAIGRAARELGCGWKV
jgi:hypothetical protein